MRGAAGRGAMEENRSERATGRPAHVNVVGGDMIPHTEPQDGGSAQGAAGADHRIVELQEQVDQLKEAVTSHAVVDQAIGMVVAMARVTPDQGWAVLREVSQHTNTKLRRVAEAIVDWGRTGELPAELRAELEDAVDRHGPTQLPGAPAL